MGDTMSLSQRRAIVRKLIQSGEIATQEDLRGALEKQGMSINQATLSRDLAELGARRVRLKEGGTVYEIPEEQAVVSTLNLESLVADITSNGNMVVVRTSPGAASAIALMIDAAKLKDVLGTIAGDDTVFVAPRSAQKAGRLADSLWSALGSKS